MCPNRQQSTVPAQSQATASPPPVFQPVSQPGGAHSLQDLQHTGINPQTQHTYSSVSSESATISVTMLPTATVKIMCSDGQVRKASVMFDTASDQTYCLKSLVDSCKPSKLGQEFIAYNSFGGEQTSKRTLRSVYQFGLIGADDNVHTVSAVEVKTICQPINRYSVPQTLLEGFNHIQLANAHRHDETIQVSLLVSIDQYWTS